MKVENFEKLQPGAESRDKIIIKTSVIGIIANVFLAVFKAFVGLMTNSIAITLDAVNNISDAASSIITIVGTKLARKEADKKHPFGYGRIEYLSAMVIALIVLYAGFTSLTESVKKIIHPETPEYTSVALMIVAVGVVVKIVLGRYVKSVGVKVDSDSLVNSGEDATLDSIISASTLVAAVVYLFAHISLESYLGAIISVVIIKSGIEMIGETVSRILGQRIDAKQAQMIKASVCEFPQIYGAYDLVLHDYGPDALQGSIHIEVPDTCSAMELDELIRDIQRKIYKEYKVALTAVSVYAVNTKDQKAIAERNKILKLVMSHEYIRQMHGFYFSESKKMIRFDLVVSLESKNREEVYKHVVEDVQKMYPDYDLNVAMDIDFSEL